MIGAAVHGTTFIGSVFQGGEREGVFKGTLGGPYWAALASECHVGHCPEFLLQAQSSLARKAYLASVCGMPIVQWV